MDEALVPRGVPTVTYLRVLNPEAGQGGDVQIDGAHVTIMEPGKPSTRHEVAHVFERGISDQEYCEATIGQNAGASLGANLNPVAAFVDDAATTVILLVGSKATRNWAFLKRIFMPFLANELFACIGDKQQRGDATLYQTNIAFSALEIQDEIIIDLLRPTSRGLTLSVSPTEGVVVQGLHRASVKTEEELRNLCLDACDNRGSPPLPPGGSIHSSTAVLEIILDQKESPVDGDGVVLNNRSRLYVVDLPCVDPIVRSASEDRILEGHSLHRSLFAFEDVFRKLSSPQTAAVAPFRTSKATQLLGEMLGGNAIVVALGMLACGEAAVSRKTMELMDNLTYARHYPISGKESSEIVQGLLVKYRSMILCLEAELLGAAHGGSATNREATSPEAVRALEDQLETVQDKLVATTLELNQAKEDNAQVFELLTLLKEKYQNLLSAKMQQEKELVETQTQKLNLARTLVDLKVEHGQLQESSEKARFELSSEILALKNELFEMDGQLQLLRAELQETKDQLNTTDKLLAAEKETTASLKAANIEVKEANTKLENRNISLSAELVTLLNTKEVLERRIEELEKEVQVHIEELTTRENESKALKAENAEMHETVNQLTDREEELVRQQNEMEFEIRTLKLELQRCKLEFEQSANEYLQTSQAGQRRDQANTAAELTRALRDKDQLSVALKKEERRTRYAQLEHKRVSDELAEMIQKYENLQKEFEESLESYRNKLTELIEPRKGTPQSSRQEMSQLSVLQSMVDSYTTNEKSLFAQLNNSEDHLRQYRTAYRALYDKYQECIDIIQDNCPDASPQQLAPAEDVLFASVAVNDTSVLERSDSISVGGDRLRLTEKQLLSEQERAAAAVVHYQGELQKAQRKILTLSDENSMLKVRLQQAESAPAGNSAEIAAMRAALLQQIEDLKVKKSHADRKPLLALQAQYQMLEKENEKMRSMLLRQGTKASDTIADPVDYIRRLEANADAACLQQLREVEGRNASLVARNAGLEEELRSYKKYMKDTVVQYKKQLKTLQSQLSDQAMSGTIRDDMGSRESKGGSKVPDRLPRISL